MQRLLRGWRDACAHACGHADVDAAPARRRRGASAGTEGEDADGGPCAALLAVRAAEVHARLLLLQPRRGHGGCVTAEAATAAAGTTDAADAAADEARALAALLSSARALHRLRRVAPRLAAAAAAAAASLPLTAALTASPPTASPSTPSAIDAARSLLPLRGLLASHLAAALHALSAPVAARRWHERSVALVRCGGGVLEQAHARLGLGLCLFSAAEAAAGGGASGGGASGGDGRGLTALWQRRGAKPTAAWPDEQPGFTQLIEARLHLLAAVRLCGRLAPPALLRDGCIALAACCGPQHAAAAARLLGLGVSPVAAQRLLSMAPLEPVRLDTRGLHGVPSLLWLNDLQADA